MLRSLLVAPAATALLLLSFHAPAAAEVVRPAEVFATSEFSATGSGAAEHLIDGSGLSGEGPVESQAHDASSTASTMWHAGPVDGGLGGPTGSPPAVIDQDLIFDLGRDRFLTGAWVWNHNQAALTGRGAQLVDIRVSSDSDPLTASFTSIGFYSLAEACGCDRQRAQYVRFFDGTDARLVKFAFVGTHSGQANEYVGLSEVRFDTRAKFSSPSRLITPRTVISVTSGTDFFPADQLLGLATDYASYETATETWIANAMAVGATREEIIELMIQLFTYVGTPKAVTGFAAAKAVFDETT